PREARIRRGGVAGGEASRNPSETQSYAASPPSSTYSGPKIAGSEGGFIGLVTGLGVFVILSGLGFWLYIRLRRNRRRGAAEGAFPDARGATMGSGGSNYGQGGNGNRGWARAADEDDAFEMPSHSAFGEGGGYQSTALDDALSPGERKQWLNPSTMSLDYEGGYAASADNLTPRDPFRDDYKDDGKEGRVSR
ncbi:hypothetical protein P7C70_g2802, partial [Phenoliferia sp. Uapishka_3]